MDDLNDIRELYNAAWNAEATRLERHPLEGDISWRYLDRHLPPTGRLLEIGFGTGAYTFSLAKRGYRITAVDLAEEFVVRCKAKADELGLRDRIDFRIGDARNLDGIPHGVFDAVLLMGPLYHLVLEDDRTAALRSAYGCLKPGGVIFSALISRFGVLANLIKRSPSWIEDQEWVRSVMANGHRPDDAPRGGFRDYFVRPEEISPMHETVGFRTLQIAGVEPAISAHDEDYNTLAGKQRDLWLDLLFEVSGEQSMVASSIHLLYVGRKGENGLGRLAGDWSEADLQEFETNRKMFDQIDEELWR